MKSLFLIIFILLIISLLFSYLSFLPKKTSMQIINEMGIGYNLGNIFDCYNNSETINNPNSQKILCGNIIPTKEMIKSIKKYGFKTIRFPITWINFIDKFGKIDSEWMSKIKEIVDWIINNNLYCILNIYYDGALILKGKKSIDYFKNLWIQIANEFKNYDELLIFESMNQIEYKYDENIDTNFLSSLTQNFIDIIRNSGGNNVNRFLLFSGAKVDLVSNLLTFYKIPFDSLNKIGISIHFYLPLQFTLIPDDSEWSYIHISGYVYKLKPIKEWGTESDYKDLINNFERLKKDYIDNGIPVVISQVGVLTEKQKEPSSIREYLNAVFSMSLNYGGMMSCLWDTSNKISGDMNYYDRENNKWYDEKIRDNFKKISKGKYIKPKDYYTITNVETVTNAQSDGSYNIILGIKKALKIILNVNIDKIYNSEVSFDIVTADKNGNWYLDSITGKIGKKQYDGSFMYIYDISNKDYNEYIRIYKRDGKDYVTYIY